MKKYTIVQAVPVMQNWTYEIVANSEEEAIQMMESGDAECCDIDVETIDWDSANIFVRSAKKIKN